MYKYFTPAKPEQIPGGYQPMVAKINCPGALMIATFLMISPKLLVFGEG
jgi:hypothetical protein